jgi:hypothetical protein
MDPDCVTMEKVAANASGASETSEIIHPAKTAVRRNLADHFAIPHDFPPDLTLKEALVRVGGALVRILVGSLLFALWGVASALAWNTIPNPFLRVLALLPLLAVFLVAMTAVMLGVTAVVKKISPKPS